MKTFFSKLVSLLNFRQRREARLHDQIMQRLLVGYERAR